MAGAPTPVFLERENYRRRRWADAAGLAPFLGLALLVLPALWASESRTADVMIYVFTVWALLILLMVVMSRRLSGPATADTPEEREQEQH